MYWIESHRTLLEHPKLRRAARALGVPRVHLIGHLHALWWWAMAYAPDGNLDGLCADDIADAMEWEGDPEMLVDALVGCGIGDGAGFLERDAAGNLAIHDWGEYGGKAVERRARDAQRKRAERRQPAPSTDDTPPAETPEPDVQRMSVGRPADIRGTAHGVQRTNKQTNKETDRTSGASAPRGAVDGDPWALVEAVFEVVGADAAVLGRADRGKQCKAAQGLLADHERTDVLSCARWLQSQDWWRQRGIDVLTVREHMARWSAAGRPEALVPSRASPATPVALGAAYKEFNVEDLP